MRGFIGLCLLTTGLSIGAYSHYPGTAQREAALVELTEIVTGAKHTHTPAHHTSTHASKSDPLTTTPPLRIAPASQRLAFANTPLFTATLPLLEKPASTASGSSPELVTPPIRATRTEQRKPRPLLIVAPTPAIKPGAATAVVHPQSWRTAVVPAAVQSDARAPDRSLKPNSNAERWRLAKSLQRELKRVGCYWGKIDGVWGKGSKWAMADFMRSVNAALPANDPDYLLLRLVSSHQNKICGRKSDGTQIAATARKPWTARVAAVAPSSTEGSRITTGSTSSQTATAYRARPAPLPGRMAIGALNRDTKPALIAPPQQIHVGDTRKRNGARVRVSALPNINRTPNNTANDADPLAVSPAQSEAATPSERYTVPVTPQRATKKVRRDRALRRAAAKKKRKRYRRAYRGRSLQSLFMHPLGRR